MQTSQFMLKKGSHNLENNASLCLILQRTFVTDDIPKYIFAGVFVLNVAEVYSEGHSRWCQY